MEYLVLNNNTVALACAAYITNGYGPCSDEPCTYTPPCNTKFRPCDYLAPEI